METLQDKVTRMEKDVAFMLEGLASLKRQLEEEKKGSDEYASTESVGSPMKKRNVGAQTQSIYPHASPPPSKRSRIDKSSLMIDDNLPYFRSGTADFSLLLTEKGHAYFDRTRYISVLAEIDDHILFCRPRRFGKSLTVSMLEHFHGLQYTNEHQTLYEGLDVQNDIAEGRVKPGQYFILKFDFSSIERGMDVKATAQDLKVVINESITEFYDTYSEHLGEDAKGLIHHTFPQISLKRCVERVRNTIQKKSNKAIADIQGIYLLVDEYDAFGNDYLEPNRPTWEGSSVESVFKSFWAEVKSLLIKHGIQRSFITGISPLSLTDIVSGFNVAKNISFNEKVSGLCGLTRSDVEAALKKACGPEDYKEHLRSMVEYCNGFYFCRSRNGETVFNTETCLDHLQDIRNGSIPCFEDPPNSEVSEQFLRRFAASACAIRDFQDTLRNDEEGNFNSIQYDQLKQSFKLQDLGKDIDNSQPAWRSLMIYFGGLTFDPDDPAHYLKIPNKVAAIRIAEAVLEKYGLSESLNASLRFFISEGDIRPVLSCYQDFMVQRDVGYTDFEKDEEIHRDSFYFSLLQNHLLRPRPEFKVTMSHKPGRIGLLLQLPRHLIVTEWKVVQIDYLDIQVPPNCNSRDREAKASVLSEYRVSQILQIKFGKWDRSRPGKTLKEWIEGEVAQQLRNYIKTDKVMKQKEDRVLLAHLVIVVGSRQILLWDMEEDGKLVDEPKLCGRGKGM